MLLPKLFPSFCTTNQGPKIQLKAPAVTHDNLDLEALVWPQLSLNLDTYTNWNWKTKKIPFFPKKPHTNPKITIQQHPSSPHSSMWPRMQCNNSDCPADLREENIVEIKATNSFFLSSRNHFLSHTCKTSEVSQSLSTAFPADSRRWEKRLPQSTAAESLQRKAAAG